MTFSGNIAARLDDVPSSVDAWALALSKELEGRGENLNNGSPADSDSRFAYECLGAAGLIGMAWPSSLGGRGMDPVEVVRVEERLG